MNAARNLLLAGLVLLAVALQAALAGDLSIVGVVPDL